MLLTIHHGIPGRYEEQVWGAWYNRGPQAEIRPRLIDYYRLPRSRRVFTILIVRVFTILIVRVFTILFLSITVFPNPHSSGLGIHSLVFCVNCLFFLAKEQNNPSLFSKNRSRHSFVKSNGRESLTVALWGEWLWAKCSPRSLKRSGEWSERFALGHNNGKSSENCQKHGANNESLMSLFVKEQFALVTLL